MISNGQSRHWPRTLLHMTALNDFFLMLLGPDGQPKGMTVPQVTARCILIFVVGLALVRIRDRRALSEKTGFDALFLVLLGSVLSRAIMARVRFG